MAACEDFVDVEQKVLKIEAQAAIKEVAFAVSVVELSTRLPCNDDLVHMNVKTKEGEHYCVELSVQGFRIVGNTFDEIQDDGKPAQYFETIYALLDTVSPEYRNSFGDALMRKLNQLQDFQSCGESNGVDNVEG